MIDDCLVMLIATACAYADVLQKGSSMLHKDVGCQLNPHSTFLP